MSLHASWAVLAICPAHPRPAWTGPLPSPSPESPRACRRGMTLAPGAGGAARTGDEGQGRKAPTTGATGRRTRGSRKAHATGTPLAESSPRRLAPADASNMMPGSVRGVHFIQRHGARAADSFPDAVWAGLPPTHRREFDASNHRRSVIVNRSNAGGASGNRSGAAKPRAAGRRLAGRGLPVRAHRHIATALFLNSKDGCRRSAVFAHSA
jgi:hypothetical protein